MPRRSRPALFAALAVAAVPVIVVAVIFAAGESQDAESAERRSVLTEPAPQTTATPSAPATPTGDPAVGREVFLTQGCGNCHTLAAAGTSGTIGPSLDARTPSYERFLEQVTIGGGGMPSYEGVITPREIEDVVAYVLASIER